MHICHNTCCWNIAVVPIELVEACNNNGADCQFDAHFQGVAFQVRSPWATLGMPIDMVEALSYKDVQLNL